MKKQRPTPLAPLASLALAALTFTGVAQAATPADGQLAQQVEQTLREAKLRHADVRAVVVDGKVNLRGWVDAPNDVLRAMQLAATVPGVEGVTSDLRTWRATERHF